MIHVIEIGGRDIESGSERDGGRAYEGEGEGEGEREREIETERQSKTKTREGGRERIRMSATPKRRHDTARIRGVKTLRSIWAKEPESSLDIENHKISKCNKRT